MYYISYHPKCSHFPMFFLVLWKSLQSHKIPSTHD
jgi:hypothetical protein